MAPLRMAAVVANGLFASYFTLKGIYPMAALNLLMMPINMIRLMQVSRLIEDIRRASAEASNKDFQYQWLEEYAQRISLDANDCLYQKADMAEEAYVLLEGEILLKESGIILSPVTLFGEMGLFTEASRRTMTAVTKTKVSLLAIKYDDILLLASENPKFSFYLMHLMVRRMMQNIDLITTKTIKASH
jgi:CRP-like cAMP-binding protein